MSHHLENEKVIKRLKRASGHLAKVIDMLERDTDCAKVAQQLQAVSSAIFNAKRTYIQDHVEHCLTQATSQKMLKEKINEFKEVAKYL